MGPHKGGRYRKVVVRSGLTVQGELMGVGQKM